MSEIKKGSRVRYITEGTALDKVSGFYPPVGTLGTVVSEFPNISEIIVKWDRGTKDDGEWLCNIRDVELVDYTEMSDEDIIETYYCCFVHKDENGVEDCDCDHCPGKELCCKGEFDPNFNERVYDVIMRLREDKERFKKVYEDANARCEDLVIENSNLLEENLKLEKENKKVDILEAKLSKAKKLNKIYSDWVYDLMCQPSVGFRGGKTPTPPYIAGYREAVEKFVDVLDVQLCAESNAVTNGRIRIFTRASVMENVIEVKKKLLEELNK